MEKVAILGKQGCVSKFDFTSRKVLWTGLLCETVTPTSIAQFGDYLLVTGESKTKHTRFYCFRDSSGQLLWTKDRSDMLKHDQTFIPLTLGQEFYFLPSPKHIAKMSWESGELLFRHQFQKTLVAKQQYRLIIAGDDVMLLSSKDVLIVDKNTGETSFYQYGLKTNALEGITCALGNGLSFISVVDAHTSEEAHEKKEGGSKSMLPFIKHHEAS